MNDDPNGWAELGRASIDAIVVVDAAGRVRLANDVAGALVRAAGHSLVGAELAAFLSPSVVRLRARASARCDGVVRTAAGAEVPVHVWTRELDDGAVAVVLRDASEWEIAKSTLSLVACGVEHAADAFEITDNGGRIEYANAAHAQLTGYPLFEGLGESITRFIDDESARMDLERALSCGESWRGEIECRKKDGSIVQQDLIVTPVLDGRGGLQRFVAIRRDISDRIAMEREYDEMHAALVMAERTAVAGRLAASVAHEVNNPATSILANLEVARDEIDQLAREIELARVTSHPANLAVLEQWWKKIRVDERLGSLRDALGDSWDGMSRVVKLVRELRSFVKPDAARAQLVSLNDVARAAAQLARPHLQDRAQLVLELGDVPRILADRTRLGQVVMNLLMNAAQAIAPGAVANNRVLLQTRRLGGDAVIIVEDTGTGIAAEDLPRVFDAFFTTKRMGEGAGLGLAVSRDVVEASGGEITVTSDGKRGTRVVVRMPAAPEARATPEPTG